MTRFVVTVVAVAITRRSGRRQRSEHRGTLDDQRVDRALLLANALFQTFDRPVDFVGGFRDVISGRRTTNATNDIRIPDDGNYFADPDVRDDVLRTETLLNFQRVNDRRRINGVPFADLF